MPKGVFHQMYRILILLSIVFYPLALTAQEDSLLNALKEANDKTKGDIYRQLTDLTLYNQNLKAEQYAKSSIEYATKTNDLWTKAYSLRLLGIYYDIHGEYQKAIDCITQGLDINKSIKDKDGISACLSSLGIIYFNKGKYDKALQIFLEVIPYYDNKANAQNKALTLSNIAAIYSYQGSKKLALDYYKDSYRLMKTTGYEKGIAICANNLGSAFKSQNQIDSALYYVLESTEMKRKFNDKRSLSSSLSNLAQLYYSLGNTEKATLYLQECITLQEEMGDLKGISSSLMTKGDMLKTANDAAGALQQYNKALAIAREIGDINTSHISSYKCAVTAYELKQFEEAAKFMYAYTIYNDSLVSLEKARSFTEMQTRFETEKKEKEIALLNQKNAQKELELTVANNEKLRRDQELKLLSKDQEVQRALLEKANSDKETEKKRNEILKKDRELQTIQLQKEKIEKEKLNEQNNKKNQQIYAFGVGLFLLLALLIFVVRGFRQKQKANKQLEIQNAQILKQKKEIETKNHIIEEKNKDVLSSINYAKRLQDAILPPIQQWEQLLSESFVLYLPKDIVAGDFYFLETIDDKVIFAAADCTGHGVPGAMVSVVCSNALNRAVKEFGLLEPGLILDKVKELVVETFSKSKDSIKDGMDVSLGVLNKSNNNLAWAGANNPLWIIRNNEDHNIEEKTCLEFKADKQPVGLYDKNQPFKTHHISLQKNDVLYLFSDGYADQFGGKNGKKFKYSSLQQKLIELSDMPMHEQKNILENTFQEWKGSLEQLDDVCVIGIRIG